MSKLWWAGIAVCIAIVTGAFYYKTRGKPDLAAVLANDAATADRIVIIPDPFDGTKIEPIEIKGAEKVGEFVRLLKFAKVGGACKCMGDFSYKFYRGNREQLTISHHHVTHLRGPWDGDAYLTAAAQTELAGWLDAQGFGYLKEKMAERNTQ